MELEKIKEINDLKEVNLEWEHKTKQILFEIQQNDVMLEKKEFERNVQMDELYSMIENQQSEIERLTTQLEHQARKEQAALVHARISMGKSIANGVNSFVGVSQGQSFVMPNLQTEPLVSPSKLQRVNSSDKLTEQNDSKPSNTNTSPEKAGDFVDEL